MCYIQETQLKIEHSIKGTGSHTFTDMAFQSSLTA